MKAVRDLAHILFWSVAIVIVFYIRMANPELTETQLLTECWVSWLVLIVMVIMYTAVLVKTKVGRDE